MLKHVLSRRIIYIGITLFLIYYIVFCRPSPQVFLTQSDIDEVTNPKNQNKTIRHRIPRIIHQTWKTKNAPPNWNITVQSVLQMNSDKFQYRVWTDTDIHNFVRQEDPYFYEHTFTKYSFDIQRIDAVRYYILYRFGGIYIDMDNGCLKPFDSLLNALEAVDPDVEHLAAFPRTKPIGISNGFMISTKEHPFLKILISRLPLFDHHFLIHYFTIMLSTGPSYLSVNEFYFNPSIYQSAVRIIDEHVYASIYTWHTTGNSWHQYDARILISIYNTWRLNYPSILYFLIIIVSFIICVFVYLLVIRHQKRNFYFLCRYFRQWSLFRKLQ